MDQEKHAGPRKKRLCVTSFLHKNIMLWREQKGNIIIWLFVWFFQDGSEKFIERVRGRFFSKKVDSEVPQRKELAPALDRLIRAVSRFYRVEREDLFYSRRGHGNEARNMAIYLARRLRGDRLREIGEAFKIGQYSTVSSIVERMKVRIGNDERLRKTVDHMITTIKMSQEQT